MRVCVLCEFSGVVRDAFIARGHDAVSCDLRASLRPGPHVKGDIRNYDWSGYDLAICHPPCQYLANSGVHLLYREPGRWERMVAAARLFTWCLELPVPMVCVENPVMHRWAKAEVGVPHSQVIQPWQYGHGESKATCLWLRGLPALRSTQIVSRRVQRVYLMSPGARRAIRRSITLPGIAEAMADQWGDQRRDTLWQGIEAESASGWR